MMVNHQTLPIPDDLSPYIESACVALQAGQLIAYPTEGVFGLGCLWQDEAAVNRLLALKQRPVSKGLIVVGSQWQHLSPLLGAVPVAQLRQIKASWPGPVTWVFPASRVVPKWITGNYSTIAVRLSAHPVIQLLCDRIGQGIVSTSANLSSEPALRDWCAVKERFSSQIAVVVPQDAGQLEGPTPIYDAITGQTLR
jgi:L-threonylcarbamoyladenylate synthase